MLQNNLNSLRHIAIIMDGNGRWAKRKKLPKIAGHQKGREVLQIIVEHCAQLSLQSLTVFAFSSENIYRPQKEVSGLFNLFLNALQSETQKLKKNNIRLNLMGDLSIFNKEIQQVIKESQQILRNCNGLMLNIALNYGGRWDITQAVKTLVQQLEKQALDLKTINEDSIAQYLCLAQQPTVDLMIRTSGEMRISNFLLWDLAYSELFFTKTLWPDFSIAEFNAILAQYQKRHRRFGT